MIEEMLKKIKEAGTIAIFTHKTPDGDALGSSTGLKLMLKKLGKEADILLEECPSKFMYLPNIANVVLEKETSKIYDLAIAVDCADVRRLQRNEDYARCKEKMIIDHHQLIDTEADVYYVKSDYPACCEVLFELCGEFGIELDKDIGTCLITGLITDTGGFRHRGINPNTFKYAAKCLEKGVDITSVYNRILHSRSMINYQMSRRTAERITFLADDRIAFTYTTKQDIDELEPKSGDFEGLVEVGLKVEGVEVSVYIKEREEGGVKVSLRAKDYVNVSEICNIFGGGGHIKAAGVMMEGTIEEVKSKIISEIEKRLK